MAKIADLRPAVEVVAAEITNLLWDRQVHERFAGIVRSNDLLLAAAQRGNPFLQGVRRWWATSAALVLRRHVDGGSDYTLRAIVQELADLDANSAPSDLRQLETVSERFRPYLTNLIHGPAASQDPRLTFNELNEAIDSIGAIAQRVYATVTNVSLRIEASPMFEWTEIFESAWIQDTAPMAYTLGDRSVPYDAIPLPQHDVPRLPKLGFSASPRPDGSCALVVKNLGAQDALDVRVFLPYAKTVCDVEIIRPGQEELCVVAPSLARLARGQAVLEFSDSDHQVYRQYADVDLADGRVRRITAVPFRVNGRIVASNIGMEA